VAEDVCLAAAQFIHKNKCDSEVQGSSLAFEKGADPKSEGTSVNKSRYVSVYS
jgi:hypothetical protein